MTRFNRGHETHLHRGLRDWHEAEPVQARCGLFVSAPTTGGPPGDPKVPWVGSRFHRPGIILRDSDAANRWNQSSTLDTMALTVQRLE